ncbi:hypothetical protein ZWY2020_015363 [Hordeum vulgare]|nr:hypothetical protein ZWY2020_015363 [Hordeum vulgare]
MDGAPFDFLSQTESSGAAAESMDGEGWGLTPPRLRRDSSGSRVPRTGNVAAPRMDLGNLDLNADYATASYPNMTMYTHILQRDSGSGQGLQKYEGEILSKDKIVASREGIEEQNPEPEGRKDDTKANDDDDDAAYGSPMSINTRKRGASSVDFRSTASSPLKKMNMENGKTKGPFLRTLKEITTRMDKEAETSNTILQAIVDQGNEKAKRSEERKVAVATCQQLAIECGAAEESIEYFVACDLFKDKHNRFVFQNMKTPQARLIWLKRWCKAKMYDEDES